MELVDTGIGQRMESDWQWNWAANVIIGLIGSGQTMIACRHLTDVSGWHVHWGDTDTGLTLTPVWHRADTDTGLTLTPGWHGHRADTVMHLLHVPWDCAVSSRDVPLPLDSVAPSCRRSSLPMTPSHPTNTCQNLPAQNKYKWAINKTDSEGWDKKDNHATLSGVIVIINMFLMNVIKTITNPWPIEPTLCYN